MGKPVVSAERLEALCNCFPFPDKAAGVVFLKKVAFFRNSELASQGSSFSLCGFSAI